MFFPNWIYQLLDGYEEHIIDTWLHGIQREFSADYHKYDLRSNGMIYFKLIRDIHIPIEEHSLIGVIPKMCKYHAEKRTPIERVLHSSHIWRETIVKVVYDFLLLHDDKVKEGLEILSYIHKRIDMLQQMASQCYVVYIQHLEEKRGELIGHLQQDRLNLLGKMAASMAHELRNPLFAIEGFLKLIRYQLERQSTDGITGYIDVIEQELSGLYQQITSFLSFSKSEELVEEFVDCSSKEIIDTVLRLVGPRLTDENIQLELENLLPNCNLYVQKRGIQQVLTNLLNNSIDALKEVPYPKKIFIRCSEESNYYYISIGDNGPGIPEELKSTVFTPFVSGKKNGTGLGLSICKQILKKNIGDIYFSSKIGETIFTLTLNKNLKHAAV